MEYRQFLSLSTSDFWRLINEKGPKVIVFPINGTRRWFILEHPHMLEDFSVNYLDAVTKEYIRVFRLIFSHGVQTLITPAFGPDLLDRGPDYVNMAAEGLVQLTTQPRFLKFFEEYGVRVRFYGDYKKCFAETEHAYLLDMFEDLTEKTKHNRCHRLFFGLFGNDATETVAKIGVDWYLKHGRVPNKREIVSAYYGEWVDPVDLFIGFDKFAAYDMPLISNGNEDLYFTVSPSLYMDSIQLRTILYDHLYTRRVEEDYEGMTAEEWKQMKLFYNLNMSTIFGVGCQQTKEMWYPAQLNGNALKHFENLETTPI